MLDEADVMLEQNWEHARDACAAANLTPQHDRGAADFSRVRAHLLDGRGNAMEWNGMEWNGMEWNGMGWDGMEWNGMEWDGVE